MCRVMWPCSPSTTLLKCVASGRRSSAWPSASLPRLMKSFCGGKRSKMGLRSLARIIVPWYAAGRKPEPQLAGPFGAKPRISGRTTNAGRLSFRLPRP